jgi:hypothetical protein
LELRGITGHANCSSGWAKRCEIAQNLEVVEGKTKAYMLVSGEDAEIQMKCSFSAHVRTHQT